MKKYRIAHKEDILKYQKNYHKSHKKERHERHKLFQKIIDDIKSNGCSICGYNDCSASIVFHHVEPKLKSCVIYNAIKTKHSKRLEEEVGKCVIICKHCHDKIHEKMKK